MKTIDQIKSIILSNRNSQLATYSGLTSSEIGEYNRSLMFGDLDEAFPDQNSWMEITD
jgi:hypothetical protein